MSGGMLRFPDEAALNAMLSKSHARVVSPHGVLPVAKPTQPKPVVTPAKQEMKAKLRDKPDYVSVLFRQILRAGLPGPTREFRFDASRKWRIDLAWPDRKIAVEIDGMAHRTKDRFMRDIEKQNELNLRGWTLVRIYTRWIATEKCEWETGIDLVKRVLGGRP